MSAMTRPHRRLFIALGVAACLTLAAGVLWLLVHPRSATLMRFDGKTTSGWVIEGDADVLDGALVLGGNQKAWARIADDFDPTCELHLEYSTENNRPIQFQWHHRALFGGGSHSVSVGQTSRKPGEWIEAIFVGKPNAAGTEWANTCKWRVVGDPAFAEQAQGGLAKTPHSVFVVFEIPAGQKLYLRNVRARTDVVPFWPWLLIVTAAALAALLAVTMAAWVIMRKVSRTSPSGVHALGRRPGAS
jgi:hypothetical protein